MSGNIQLPDGESIPVAYVPRGSRPDDPAYQPGGPRQYVDDQALGTVPVQGPEPVAGPGDEGTRVPQTVGQVAEPVSADSAGQAETQDLARDVPDADEFAAAREQLGVAPGTRISIEKGGIDYADGDLDAPGPIGTIKDGVIETPADISDAPDVDDQTPVQGELASAIQSAIGLPGCPSGLSQALTNFPEAAVMGRWPEQATVTVEYPDGSVHDVGPGKYAIASGNVADQVRITANGLFVNNQPVPAPGLQQRVAVEHPTCDDDIIEVTVTYYTREVVVHQDEVVPLIADDIPHHESEHGCTCQLEEPTKTVVGLLNQTRRGLRRFVLQRNRDETGISGTGIVAEGVLLTDGRAVVRWLGKNSSIVVWNNLNEAMQVHGHKGSTRLRWIDHP